MEKGREKDRDAKTEYLLGMRATNKVFCIIVCIVRAKRKIIV